MSEELKPISDELYVSSLGIFVAKHVSEGNISALVAYLHSLTLRELQIVSQLALTMNTILYSERGEWTADFVDLGYSSGIQTSRGYIEALYISHPDSVVNQNGVWTALGGKQIPLLLPPNGWIIPDESGKIYDNRTGSPLKTTERMEEAGSSNYSYFWRGEKEEGLVAVNRECERMQGTSFEISIIQEPDFYHENIGLRRIRRI